MATKTAGTSATNSLTALAFLGSGLLPADVAAIAEGILDDGGVVGWSDADRGKGQIVPGAWDQGGGSRLYIPNRGVLKVLPGDWVGIDSQGWPILISANSIANAAWTHS